MSGGSRTPGGGYALGQQQRRPSLSSSSGTTAILHGINGDNANNGMTHSHARNASVASSSASVGSQSRVRAGSVQQLNAASVFAKLGLPTSPTTASPVDINLPSLSAFSPDAATASESLAQTTSQVDGAASPCATAAQTPASMRAIDADILLPFSDRPAEVVDLLENVPINQPLLDTLLEIFKRKGNSSSDHSPSGTSGTHSLVDASVSSGLRWTYDDLQAHFRIPRTDLCDQDWIDILKAHVYPRSAVLWERLRACLGVDVDDERGGDRYEPLSSDIIMPEHELDSSLVDVDATPGIDSRSSYFINQPSPREILRTYSGSSGNAPSGTVTPSGRSRIPPPAFTMDLRSPSPQPPVTLAPSSANQAQPQTVSLLSAQLSNAPAIPGHSPRSIPIGLRHDTSPARPPASLGPALPSSSTFSNFSLTSHQPIPLSSNATSYSGTSSPASISSTAASPAASPSSSRMHRRTSSGGSNFRRSFAMSSIAEDSACDTFTSSHTPSTPNLTNDSLSVSSSRDNSGERSAVVDDSPERPNRNDEQPQQPLSASLGVGGAGAGGGFALGPNATSLVNPSPGYGSTHRVEVGHLLPTSSANGRLPTGNMSPYLQPLGSSALSTSSLSSSIPAVSPMLSGYSISPSSANGLGPLPAGHAGSSGTSGPSLPPVGLGMHADAQQTHLSPQKYRDYDNYAVFESEDGESASVSGSVRSTGRGPGVGRAAVILDDRSTIG